MTGVRTIVVDDESIARRGLRALVEKRADLEFVGECRNGAEAVAAIRALAPQLVVMDIQMPGLDGFAVIDTIGAAEMPEVVFVTAFNQFALKAFDAAAIDYVVKPYTEERLDQALSRAVDRLHQRSAAGAHARLLSVLAEAELPLPSAVHQRREPITRLLVSVGTKSVVVPVASILVLHADGAYVRARTTHGTYTLRESLNDLETRLDGREFLRVHRSTIVRLDAVGAIDRAQPDRLFVILTDGTRVPVSRSRRDAIVGALSSVRG